jgi:hypothetical protein
MLRIARFSVRDLHQVSTKFEPDTEEINRTPKKISIYAHGS